MASPPTSEPRTLVILGVGLIGGSIACAARSRGLFERIVGVGRDERRMQAAVELGIIDEYELDATQAVRSADLVVVCTPVDQIARDVIAIAPFMPKQGTITDAGSTKQNICEQISEALGHGHCFVGAHPMAGSEKTGFENAAASLFEQATVVLTPDSASQPAHVEKVRTFWEGLGGVSFTMSPVEHDLAVAMTSHLPHLISSALAASVTEKDLPLAASGFGDTTRIAAGSPQLWTSIFLENDTATLQAVEEFQRRLSTLVEALKARNADRLMALLKAGKRVRDLWQTENSRVD